MLRKCDRIRNAILPVIASAWLSAFAGAAEAQTAPYPWSFAGADQSNSHAMLSPPSGFNPATQINPANASKLKMLWSFATSGDISATPTVEAGGLYVPDWGGMLYKLDPATGAVIWKNPVSNYTGFVNNSISRSSPAIGPNVIVLGDCIAHFGVANPGARVFAVDKATGAPVWTTVVDPYPYASILGSPVIAGNLVYIGTASWDEGEAGSDPNFVPGFRGTMSALNLTTGAIVWQFTTVPSGYTGGPAPGSSPVVFGAGHALIFTTGNNYTVPTSVGPCVQAAGGNIAAQNACLSPADYEDSVVSVDLATGKLNWARRMTGYDAWTIACIDGYASCPNPAGADQDFASAPNLTWAPNFVGVKDDRGGTSQSYWVGAGQKNSYYYALNPYNGGLFWSTMVGVGGIEWGSAINSDDGNAVYVALNNPQNVSNVLTGPKGVPVASSSGAWISLNITTGKPNWQVPAYGQDLVNPAKGAHAPGSLTFSNRVLFAGASSGYMTAIDANTGAIYWTFASGGTVVSSPAIYNETVYWGTGYARNGVGKHMLYAFSVPAP